MKILPADVATIYAAFVENEIAPKALNGLQKFAAYGSIFVVQQKAAAFFADSERIAQLEAIGVMDGGLIDLDYLYQMASFAMQKAGGKITVMGLILDQSDMEKICQLGRSVAQA